MSVLRSRTFVVLAAAAACLALLAGALVLKGQLRLPAQLHEMLGDAEGAANGDQFSKQASDRNGGALNEGDVIDYVLSYSPAAAELTIIDRLSANLHYVPGTLYAFGWSVTPTPPYSVNNSTTYKTEPFGTGFAGTVPATFGLSGISSAGQDGTIPIPIKDRVYGIFHHQEYGDARIMCWDIYSLQPCATAPGGGTWPRSLDDPGDQRWTLSTLHHVVLGSRIYYVSPRTTNSSSGATTTVGIGCWDTQVEGTCPFIPLPVSYLGSNFDDTTAAGVVGVSDLSSAPSNTHVYVAAGDRVFCVDVTTGSICWQSQPLNGSGSNGMHDIILEASASPSVLYAAVTHTSGARVACIELATGAFCAGWGGVKTVALAPVTLSPLLSMTGSATVGVCVHEFDLMYTMTTTPAKCLAASDGSSIANPGIPAVNIFVAFPMAAPNQTKVLYPQFNSAVSVKCFDFATNTACSGFTPSWPNTSLDPDDYAYATDPVHPQNCVLGLGHNKTLWRFNTQGKIHDPVTDPTVCQFPATYTFDIDERFCARKPQQAVWTQVRFHNRPPELIGGTIKVYDTNGALLQTIVVVDGTLAYPLNIPATGTSRIIKVEFDPTYPADKKPTQDYKIVVDFSAEINPQICYSTKVKGCGQAENRAALSNTRTGQTFPASALLGPVVGGSCKAQSVIKVCKVAGEGVREGTEFAFSDGRTGIAVPAGPSPGGYCKILGEYAEGATVTVSETGQPGYTVANIDVPGAADLNPNLRAGSITVQVPPGVMEIIFTNERKTGFLEICKSGDVRGYFRFEVTGLREPVTVPAGACSPALEVAAGAVRITELANDGAQVLTCSAFPTDRLVRCDAAANTVVVKVVRGGLSTQTIASVTNRPVAGETASLLIYKSYVHPLSGPIRTYPPGVSFPLSVRCHDPANPSQPQMTQTAMIVSPQTGPVAVPGLPVGWVCEVSEAENSVPDANGCYWAPESHLLPHPVSILAAPRHSIALLKNNYVCKANPAFDVDIANFEIPGPGDKAHGYWPCGKGEKAFRIVVQNTGSGSIGSAVLNTLTVGETKQPAGAVITGFGNTDTSKWSCGASGGAAVSCTFTGASSLPGQQLNAFETLPALEVCVKPGSNPLKSNCAAFATTPTDNDLTNNSSCVEY